MVAYTEEGHLKIILLMSDTEMGTNVFVPKMVKINFCTIPLGFNEF